MSVWSRSIVNRVRIRNIINSYINHGLNSWREQVVHFPPAVSTRRHLTEQPEAPSILQPTNRSSATALRVKKINKAMQAYLERSQNYESFVHLKEEEFEIGKHHLANMMGVDVAEMNQENINKAIEYLLPSGLFEPRSRPVMKHPREMYPKEKAAQFDYSGRPFNVFFYTGKANFYQAIHEALVKFKELDELEDKMIKKGVLSVPSQRLLNLSGSEFLGQERLSELFIEKIDDPEYQFFIETFTRLARHPYAFRCKDFLWKFRKDLQDISKLEDVPELTYDENGRPFMEASTFRLEAVAKVKVLGNGTGKFTVNNKDVTYFKLLQNREQVMFPLEYSGMLGKVDVEATVEKGGTTSQAAAVRLGIALCLKSMVSEEVREKMRLAGLLTVDIRTRERKKPGQKGARAKYKWLKR